MIRSVCPQSHPAGPVWCLRWSWHGNLCHFLSCLWRASLLSDWLLRRHQGSHALLWKHLRKGKEILKQVLKINTTHIYRHTHTHTHTHTVPHPAAQTQALPHLWPPWHHSQSQGRNPGSAAGCSVPPARAGSKHLKQTEPRRHHMCPLHQPSGLHQAKWVCMSETT